MTIPSWWARGLLFENCSCQLLCRAHVSFKQPCDGERCIGHWAAHLTDGRYGGLSLGGRSVLVVFESPVRMHEGGWTERLYIDDGADASQRAALEAIALQSADLLDAMHADGAASLTQLRVDGGASRNDLLMQIQADLLGVPVVRPAETETTALGAAYLAGLGVGVYPDVEAISANWRIDRTFEPQADAGQMQAMRVQWSRAIERSKGWMES